MKNKTKDNTNWTNGSNNTLQSTSDGGKKIKIKQNKAEMTKLT